MRGRKEVEQINYEALLPKTPPVDLVQWALKQKLFKEEYLIYKMGRVYDPLEDRAKPAVEVVCTGCGERFYAEKVAVGGCGERYAPAPFGWWNWEMEESVISGGVTMCPTCGCKAKTVHVGNVPAGIENNVWITMATRLLVEGHQDRFVLTDWMVKRRVEKTGEKRYTVDPYSAWVMEEKKIVRLMGYIKTIGGNVSLHHRWEQRKQYCDVYGKMEIMYPWDPSILEGTTAENCKLDLYIKAGGERLVSYLALWRKRPTVENLLVQGCGYLIADLIDREKESYLDRGGVPRVKDINWKERRPAQMLGLNKEELRCMRQMKWGTETLKAYRLIKGAGIPVKLPEDLKLLKNKRGYEVKTIIEEGGPGDFWRILRYLKKQKQEFFLLRDYWNMANKLHRDLTNSLVRWPRDLKAAHDKAMDEQKEREHAELHELFVKRAEELDWLSFAMDGLLIRPCRSEGELIREGNKLNHCVASYAKKHAEGKSAILLIRRTEKPEEPFFTLEFDEKKRLVLQNRGLRNCDRTKAVKEFEEAWLQWIKSGMPRSKDGRPVGAKPLVKNNKKEVHVA